ncbi:hypothetical protein MOPEL_066_00020 [Mobilicoccus pelagius NBRC 104925]|uniref:Uncharacterized protein n=1 Tax=Mobilicoccus pelagius NBRC 104925 TaxID=1089455 RepID=H5UQZ2_9MICO|nr:hypothetical protein MOPEL_066_00020 [Mobilicoccus pelagius NBRC 104925]
MQLLQTFVDDGITCGPLRDRPALAGIIGAWGDRDSSLFQDLADRLDPMLVAVRGNERIDVYGRRSSSA